MYTKHKIMYADHCILSGRMKYSSKTKIDSGAKCKAYSNQ